MTIPLYLAAALCILSAAGAFALGRSIASPSSTDFDHMVEVTGFEVRPGDVVLDLRLSADAQEIFNRGRTEGCHFSIQGEEVNDMGLTKHGHGDILPEEGDLTKQAKTEDEKEILDALAEENIAADK